MPLLRDLDARFTKYVEGVYETRSALVDADGVRFVCPKCKGSGEWPHPILIGFLGRARAGDYGHNSKGEPVLWTLDPSSTSLDDLVLTPSIQIEGGCNWHGFVGSSGMPPGNAA